MNICPCIDTIYKGYPLEEALAGVRENGYAGFEFWFYKSYDMGRMTELKERLGLTVVNMNSELVSLTDPSERGRFMRELGETARQAKKAGCRRITVLSGDDTGEERRAQRQSIVAGLKEAAALAKAEQIMVVLEASNRRVNRPNNYLTRAEEAFEIIGEVDSPRVKMLYDIYHQQISEGDLLRRIIPNISLIGHFHAAGVPDRHELHLCEINYDYVLREIEKTGYPYWVGLEYFPSLKPETGLRMVSKYLGGCV